jgi:hypothetical protein
MNEVRFHLVVNQLPNISPIVGVIQIMKTI